jgi:3-hydroxyisobutyrate dehydrogenase-like beta-hydroxyacid dehydrogenase
VNQILTIGILYPGDMGAAMARALRADGHRTITTLRERSQRTIELARAAGVEALDDLDEVIEASDVVLSLVSPASALPVAQQVAACRRRRADAIYVDANSTSPMMARQMAGLLERRGFRFVDATIHGSASRLSELGLVHLSGAAADGVSDLFSRFVAVRPLGDEPGRASAMKMLVSSMVKGIIALFVETSVAGREAGLLDEFLATMSQIYPGVMALVGRALPTYPRHAARRIEELHELEATLRDLGLEPHVAPAVRRLIEILAESDLHCYATGIEQGLFELEDLIELIALHYPLRTGESAQQLSASNA